MWSRGIKKRWKQSEASDSHPSGYEVVLLESSSGMFTSW